MSFSATYKYKMKMRAPTAGKRLVSHAYLFLGLAISTSLTLIMTQVRAVEGAGPSRSTKEKSPDYVQSPPGWTTNKASGSSLDEQPDKRLLDAEPIWDWVELQSVNDQLSSLTLEDMRRLFANEDFPGSTGQDQQLLRLLDHSAMIQAQAQARQGGPHLHEESTSSISGLIQKLQSFFQKNGVRYASQINAMKETCASAAACAQDIVLPAAYEGAKCVVGTAADVAETAASGARTTATALTERYCNPDYTLADAQEELKEGLQQGACDVAAKCKEKACELATTAGDMVRTSVVPPVVKQLEAVTPKPVSKVLRRTLLGDEDGTSTSVVDHNVGDQLQVQQEEAEEEAQGEQGGDEEMMTSMKIWSVANRGVEHVRNMGIKPVGAYLHACTTTKNYLCALPQLMATGAAASTMPITMLAARAAMASGMLNPQVTTTTLGNRLNEISKDLLNLPIVESREQVKISEYFRQHIVDAVNSAQIAYMIMSQSVSFWLRKSVVLGRDDAGLRIWISDPTASDFFCGKAGSCRHFAASSLIADSTLCAGSLVKNPFYEHIDDVVVQQDEEQEMQQMLKDSQRPYHHRSLTKKEVAGAFILQLANVYDSLTELFAAYTAFQKNTDFSMQQLLDVQLAQAAIEREKAQPPQQLQDLLRKMNSKEDGAIPKVMIEPLKYLYKAISSIFKRLRAKFKQHHDLRKIKEQEVGKEDAADAGSEEDGEENEGADLSKMSAEELKLEIEQDEASEKAMLELFEELVKEQKEELLQVKQEQQEEDAASSPTQEPAGEWQGGASPSEAASSTSATGFSASSKEDPGFPSAPDAASPDPSTSTFQSIIDSVLLPQVEGLNRLRKVLAKAASCTRTTCDEHVGEQDCSPEDGDYTFVFPTSSPAAEYEDAEEGGRAAEDFQDCIDKGKEDENESYDVAGVPVYSCKEAPKELIDRHLQSPAQKDAEITRLHVCARNVLLEKKRETMRTHWDLAKPKKLTTWIRWLRIGYLANYGRTISATTTLASSLGATDLLTVTNPMAAVRRFVWQALGLLDTRYDQLFLQTNVNEMLSTDRQRKMEQYLREEEVDVGTEVTPDAAGIISTSPGGTGTLAEVVKVPSKEEQQQDEDATSNVDDAPPPPLLSFTTRNLKTLEPPSEDLVEPKVVKQQQQQEPSFANGKIDDDRRNYVHILRTQSANGGKEYASDIAFALRMHEMFRVLSFLYDLLTNRTTTSQEGESTSMTEIGRFLNLDKGEKNPSLLLLAEGLKLALHYRAEVGSLPQKALFSILNQMERRAKNQLEKEKKLLKGQEDEQTSLFGGLGKFFGKGAKVEQTQDADAESSPRTVRSEGVPSSTTKPDYATNWTSMWRFGLRSLLVMEGGGGGAASHLATNTALIDFGMYLAHHSDDEMISVFSKFQDGNGSKSEALLAVLCLVPPQKWKDLTGFPYPALATVFAKQVVAVKDGHPTPSASVAA
ncbi:unnamed protein product [Amoebophrya sp. A25]|nr:unnamed protein product [Amoebophrya sp. A25]|eukprot:GSA25T00001430001.1